MRVLVISASDLPMHTIKFCSVVFVVTSKLPVTDKQDSLMHGAAAFVDHGRWMMHKCYNLYSNVKMSMTRNGPAVINATDRYWSKSQFLPKLGVLLEYCHNV